MSITSSCRPVNTIFGRRTFLTLIFTGLLLPGCGRSGGGSDAPVLRVSLQPIPAYAPLWVAKRKGWLEEEMSQRHQGTVEWIVIRDGPLQNEAFGAGLLDVALMGDTPAIIGNAGGLPTRIISVASISPGSLAVLVPVDSPIQRPEDLKGKKVGVTKGSFCHHLLALVLQKAGLTLNDIQFINMAAPEINTSLQGGQIDAGVTWEPYISQLVAASAGRVLVDGTGIKRGDEVIVAREPFATAHPEIVRTLLEVYKRGQDYILTEPEAAAELIAEDVKLPAPLVATMFAKTDYTPGLKFEDLTEFEQTEAFLRELGVTRRSVKVDNFVDRRFFAEATP